MKLSATLLAGAAFALTAGCTQNQTQDANAINAATNATENAAAATQNAADAMDNAAKATENAADNTAAATDAAAEAPKPAEGGEAAAPAESNSGK